MGPGALDLRSIALACSRAGRATFFRRTAASQCNGPSSTNSPASGYLTMLYEHRRPALAGVKTMRSAARNLIYWAPPSRRAVNASPSRLFWAALMAPSRINVAIPCT
jgi:hypothetical protein